MTETDARIVNDFVAGSDVPAIAARYAVSEEYVDQVIDQTHLDKKIVVKAKRDWSLNRWGNRLVYSIIAGFVVNITTGIYAFGTVIAVVLFFLSTAIVVAARGRYAGTDRQA